MMPDDLKQSTTRLKFGCSSRHYTTSLALQMSQICIIHAGCAGLNEFTTDRTGRTAKAFSNIVGAAQVIAHSHDECALLSGEITIDFWHGNTLQQGVLHLVIEAALS